MSITKLYSAPIFVNDLDQAIDFYVNKLGFEKRIDEPFDEERHRWVEVVPKGSDTALILTHGYGGWSPEKVGGNSGLMFSVDDMASTFETLKAQGVSFKGEPDITPFGIFATFKDPDGNAFTLHQEVRE
ncbi:MAG: VOC family protein [Deinococcota bacterium]|jgi:predicted enzyme related to lactoylglutathione lyase|nr:VOC family protein [Deinococcota bacterium]